ncbi:MAG TPA: 3-phosphoshikimate 1-carboxyvinyltransferase [Blastocatellia bacterium]|nr:3-phosphoshikimate 1-carboxyvinyltransferase [Blastocatellia bacterium]
MSDSTKFSPDLVNISASPRLRGSFRLPGDKSISHRSAILASIAEGESRLHNYSSARDCHGTLDCMAALGVEIRHEADSIVVNGVGLNGLRAASRTLDVGNSGSTIRMLSGVLAGQSFTTEITGDGSIQRRPMKRVIDPLTEMGARIESQAGYLAPLRISGGGLRALEYRPPVASAQVKTCVLLAGLFAGGVTTVIEQTPTRNHTEVMLRECGVEVKIESSEEGERISVAGGSALRALGDYTVAGDLSSAAFFITAALITPDSEIRLRDIEINPSRMAWIHALQEVGARIELVNPRQVHGEPVADLVGRSSRLTGELELSGAVVANLIDEVPILAVAATQLHGTLTIRDARELRVKESDRIRAIADNLRRLGIELEEFEDGLRIAGPQRLRGAEVESFGDHRIAMSFAVAGLIAEGQTRIHEADSAAVSLPQFYQLLAESGAIITPGPVV